LRLYNVLEAGTEVLIIRIVPESVAVME